MGDLTLTDLQMIKREQRLDLLKQNLTLLHRGKLLSEFLIRVYQLAKQRDDEELFGLVQSTFEKVFGYTKLMNDKSITENTSSVVSIHKGSFKRLFDNVLDELVSPVQLLVYREFWQDLGEIPNPEVAKLMNDYSSVLNEYTDMAKQSFLEISE